MASDPLLKLVFVAPFGIRPKGTVIARMLPLAVELQALGHSVVIVAPPYTNPEDSGKTEVLRGVRLVNIRLSFAWKPVAAWLMAWRMFCAALAERPAVVHLFKPKGYGGVAVMLMLCARRLGLRMPQIMVDTDDWEGRGGMNDLHDYSSLEKRVFAFQEQWLLPRAAAVTVASRGLEVMVAALGVPAGSLFYLPNCVQNTAPGNGLWVRQKLGIPVESPVVLLYTRFFEFSQEKLHAVFAELFQRVPAVRFLVVGKGRNNEEELLFLAARAKGFSRALVMAGWVEPKELPDYLAAGDVAIYPFADTRINRTKCPAKITELLLAEVAVVADHVGQLAEYVRPGLSGELCDPDDWLEMASKAADLLHDPARRKSLAKAGRSRMLADFRWEAQAVSLSRYYRKILAGVITGPGGR